MKLVLPESESRALHREMRRWPRRATSVVGEIELQRTVLKAGFEAEYRTRARAALVQTTAVAITPGIIELAVNRIPTSLRSLDAIHLASALALEDDLGAFIAYDRRLLDAAAELGLPVLSPA